MGDKAKLETSQLVSRLQHLGEKVKRFFVAGTESCCVCCSTFGSWTFWIPAPRSSFCNRAEYIRPLFWLCVPGSLVGGFSLGNFSVSSLLEKCRPQLAPALEGTKRSPYLLPEDAGEVGSAAIQLILTTRWQVSSTLYLTLGQINRQPLINLTQALNWPQALGEVRH